MHLHIVLYYEWHTINRVKELYKVFHLPFSIHCEEVIRESP